MALRLSHLAYGAAVLLPLAALDFRFASDVELPPILPSRAAATDRGSL